MNSKEEGALRIRKDYLADRVVEALRSKIAEGGFGDSLPGERVLAQMMQVSRRVVREALAILDAENAVIRAPAGRARRLRADVIPGDRVRRVGFLTASAEGAALAPVLALYESLARLCARCGWECRYIVCTESTSREADTAVKGLIGTHHCDLWVGSALRSPAILDALHARGARVVGCNFFADKPYCVVAYDFDSARVHAVNLLLRKGRRRVICPVFPPVRPALVEALRKLHEERGLPFGQETHLPFMKRTKAGFLEFLESTFRNASRPDGLVLSQTAIIRLITLQGWLMTKKLSYPEDLSVLCISLPESRELMVPVPGGYDGGERLLRTMLVRVVRDFIRTGRLSDGRRTVMTEYFPGGSE